VEGFSEHLTRAGLALRRVARPGAAPFGFACPLKAEVICSYAPRCSAAAVPNDGGSLLCCVNNVGLKPPRSTKPQPAIGAVARCR